MTVTEIVERLRALGSEKLREQNIRHGAGENQFGIKMGDIRAIAKEIKVNPELAAELWKVHNTDAQLLSILIMKPAAISADELEAMVKSVTYTQLADWLNSYVVKAHPEKERLRAKWMQSRDPMLSRAAWSLTSERISKNPEGLDLKGLLDRIEKEMPAAPGAAQWTMNYCLAGIGINFPEHRARALDIGEKLGIYRDYPTPKGCTSPFAPLWINEMVSRQS